MNAGRIKTLLLYSLIPLLPYLLIHVRLVFFYGHLDTDKMFAVIENLPLSLPLLVAFFIAGYKGAKAVMNIHSKEKLLNSPIVSGLIIGIVANLYIAFLLFLTDTSYYFFMHLNIGGFVFALLGGFRARNPKPFASKTWQKVLLFLPVLPYLFIMLILSATSDPLYQLSVYDNHTILEHEQGYQLTYPNSWKAVDIPFSISIISPLNRTEALIELDSHHVLNAKSDDLLSQVKDAAKRNLLFELRNKKIKSMKRTTLNGNEAILLTLEPPKNSPYPIEQTYVIKSDRSSKDDIIELALITLKTKNNMDKKTRDEANAIIQSFSQ